MFVADLMGLAGKVATCCHPMQSHAAKSLSTIYTPWTSIMSPPNQKKTLKKQGNQTTKSCSNSSFDLFRFFQLRCRMVAHFPVQLRAALSRDAWKSLPSNSCWLKNRCELYSLYGLVDVVEFIIHMEHVISQFQLVFVLYPSLSQNIPSVGC